MYQIQMPHLVTHKLVLLLVFTMIHFPSMHSHIDKHALLCLKSQLSGPSGALASWRNASLAVCDWHGVSCSRRPASRVISLDLESLNITGQIFPCIAELPFLARIHMPNNHISGHISPDIGRLTRLRYLNLSVNSLSGTIPDTVSFCSRLETISLQGNSLEGQIPQTLSQCSFLKQIVLSNNNLQGGIPSKFGLLPHLSVLLLTSNKLTGNIPQFLGSNNFLTLVNLKNNSLSGGIPPALFNSTTLCYIDLSYNYLSGSISPFSQTSPPLEYLALTKNHLSGEIPVSLGNFSSLSSLLLDQNNFQGSIPGSLSNISSLQVLNLKDNNLSGIVPPALYTIPSLTYLSLSLNNLSGRIPTDIGYTLPNIRELILGGNKLDGPIPASLANASNLKNLDLRENSLTGVIPPLGLLHKLAILDIGTNKLEAGDWTFFSSLTNCTQLQMLCLDYNSLEGTIPNYVANLSKNLKFLLLSKNQLTGAIPSEIGMLTSLTVLIMHKNSLSGHIPDTLGNLQKLSILSLSQNKLSGEIPQSIGKLEQLTELYLMENNLTGHIPASLAGCKSLLTLNLSVNNLHGGIPIDIFSIFTLSKGLDLSDNQLTEGIPSEVGRLINLNILSFSNNQLSGEIPSTLGQCLLLESLHLEANFLQGKIPASLSTLQGISEMDLSQNNLSGIIPEFFQSFRSLQTLNLSFNDLEGLVPKGGVFYNSSGVFLQGNKKLCASSPMQQLALCKILASKKKKTSYIVAVVVSLTSVVLLSLACLSYIPLKKSGKAKQPNINSFKQLKKFSYRDLFKATNGFSSANFVGSGRFGLVYRGQLRLEICSVAIKVFKLDQFGASKSFVAECEALRNIRHRNLIGVISVCSTFDPTGNEFKALVLEYMENGNLERWLHAKEYKQGPRQPLGLDSRITIAMDIAAALDYLHNRCAPPLAHCDLKPSNVLLDDKMIARLSDFGLAKFLYSGDLTGLNDSLSIVGLRGSTGYIAPEYGMDCRISIRGDVYSYGIIILEMITGKRPTDEMFKDGMNLHNFVEAAFPHKIDEILEPSLSGYHIDEGANLGTIEIQWCVMQLAQLGLKCSEMSPMDRPTTEDVYAEIVTIKEKFSAFLN